MRRTVNYTGSVLVTLLVLTPYTCSGTAICYYPNGNVASSYQPCNYSDGSAAAACCELSSSACSTTGYCYGSAGVMYRGGCTDSTWSSVNCAARCKDVNSGSFSNINLCPGTEHNILFTCSGSGSFTIDMCQTNFTINAGVPFTPSSTSSASQGTTTVTTTTTALASSTSSAACVPSLSDTAQQSCSDPVRTVGLALGLPLGALAAFLVAVIFWQHRTYVSRPGPSGRSQGYPASQYTAGISNTMYGAGTETTIGQQYPQYYPQQQSEWKPQGPQSPPSELLSHVPMHEVQA